MTRDEKKRYLHKRVILTQPDGTSIVGIAQGVNAQGDVMIMYDGTHVREYVHCESLTLAQYTCERCRATTNTIFDDLCASCARDKIKATPFAGTPCDGCGRNGAVRNPKTKKNEYFCVSCHGERGEELMMTGGMSGLLSSCAHLRLEHPEHEFIRVRGTRYRCRRCNQDYWGSGRDINVVGEAQGWKEKAGLS